MQRIKTLDVDGVDVKLGALSLDQVEEFLEKQRDALGLNKAGKEVEGKKPDPEKMVGVWRDFLCVGLNNASPDAKWTPKRIGSEFDLVFYDRLRETLLEFSGLREETKTLPVISTAPVGEATAS